MVGTNTNVILKIYKSRNVILQHLKKLDYDETDYENFSINEIDAMFTHSQLDMLLTHKQNGTKVYVKYFFSLNQKNRQFRPQNLDNIIDDLFHIDKVLTKNDTLIVIVDDEPNETITNVMKYLYEKSGVFVVIHNVKRLQFNIFEHTMIPKVNLLNEEETSELMKKMNLKSLKQLPEISRFDPLALAMLMRPKQVMKIVRSSPTALNSDFYRVCV